MKIILACLISTLFCGSCLALPEVEFVYFNLSTNEIWIQRVIGLPADASPGRLAPVKSEDQLSETRMTFFETVRVADKLKIVWKDNEPKGWPGGSKPGDLSRPGVVHEAEFKRDDLKIPARMKSGKVRFTFLGNDKWRITFSGK